MKASSFSFWHSGQSTITDKVVCGLLPAFQKKSILQPDSNTICAYIEFLTRSFNSPDAVSNCVCGVRHLYKTINHPTDTLDSFEVRLTLRTCRGDILFQHPGIVITLKWSKTCQDHKTVNLIPIPKIPVQPMCPVQAYHMRTGQFPAK